MPAPPPVRDFRLRPPTHPVKVPKLIRDKMPQYHARDKCEAHYRIVTDDAEYVHLLGEKLREEVEEFLANPSAEEWADVRSVLRTIGKVVGIDEMHADAAMFEKEQHLGAFDSRLLMTRFEWGPEPDPSSVGAPECPTECVCGHPVTSGSVRWNGETWEHKDAFTQGGHHPMVAS